MTSTMRRFALLTAVGLAANFGANASAIELLTSGDFEVVTGPAAPEVPSWTLLEVVSGTSTARGAAALAGFADNPLDPENPNPDDRGLWLQAFNGDPDPGTVDAVLTQIVPGTPGEMYTFSGQAAFEANYSGGVAFLDPLSPWGAIESPTETEFELAFLDAGGAVIGTPLVRDLRTEVFSGFGYTPVSPLSGVAPAGTASVRVQARALQMADAGLNPQSAFLDNFSLTTSSAPTTELLANPSLNILPPTPPSPEEILGEFFDFVEDPAESTDIIRVAGFANNAATGGTNGIWISPFLESAQGGSAVVSQTVAGSPGTEYTFSAGARWEAAFVGDASTTDENKAEIELAFLDEFGAVISSSVLDLRADGKTAAADSWTTHSVMGTAPAGTVDVKVSGIISNLTTAASGAQSAFWDDFSLMAAGGLPGDYNGDGTVDAADYTVWRDGNSPDSSPAGYTLWANNYGTSSSSAAGLSVPEPAAAALVALALLSVPRRRS